ncbi:MAG: GPO family capsid scaffolding protein [Alcaligenaceae bacterium]|nr:GPO family capsid scaffolding protein [Alcaligenaceae bacterium]
MKTKFFRIATEGATSDGRAIDRSWLKEMAENYDPKKYAARVWVEHLRSLSPNGDFGAYGDVLELETREVEDGKLALFAQIAPLPALVELSQKRQKIFTSMEVDPEFADTGKAYLVGLAVTDSPASLGTEILEFSAKNPKASPFTSRKQRPENVFSAATPAEIAIEDDNQSLVERVRKFFAKPAPKDGSDASSAPATRAADDASDIHSAIELVAEKVAGIDTKFATLEQDVSDISSIKKDLVDLKSGFTELLSNLEQQDADPGSQRRPASGGSVQALTDC